MVLSIGFQLDGMSGPGSGTWTRFSSLATALTARGHDVHISGELGTHDAALDLRVASLELHQPATPIGRVLRRQRLLRQFARLSALDVIHLEAPPFIGIPSTPSIASLHDSRHFDRTFTTTNSLAKIYQKKILRWFSPHISCWLALSEYAKTEICLNIGIDELAVHVIPPIVERNGNVSLKKPICLSGKECFVLVLGHLEPRKNIETIIKATFEPSWPPGLELWIAGKDQGSLPALKHLAAKSRINIRFFDSPSEEEKWYLLKSAQMVAVPSLVEGFGIVAVEAALSKTVALVSDATATRELAGDPFATFPVLDPRAWADGVNHVQHSSNLRTRLGASQAALARLFSADTVLPKLEDVYQRVLQSR